MYVLIVIILTWGSNGGNAVAMHEFSSLETCHRARTAIDGSAVRAICVPK